LIWKIRVPGTCWASRPMYIQNPVPVPSIHLAHALALPLPSLHTRHTNRGTLTVTAPLALVIIPLVLVFNYSSTLILIEQSRCPPRPAPRTAQRGAVPSASPVRSRFQHHTHESVHSHCHSASINIVVLLLSSPPLFASTGAARSGAVPSAPPARSRLPSYTRIGAHSPPQRRSLVSLVYYSSTLLLSSPVFVRLHRRRAQQWRRTLRLARARLPSYIRIGVHTHCHSASSFIGLL